jgi:hypothetical protein
MTDQPELRYRDGPTTQVDLVIAAPAPVVWALVCDIQLPARFSSEFDGGAWLDGATRPVQQRVRRRPVAGRRKRPGARRPVHRS